MVLSTFHTGTPAFQLTSLVDSQSACLLVSWQHYSALLSFRGWQSYQWLLPRRTCGLMHVQAFLQCGDAHPLWWSLHGLPCPCCYHYRWVWQDYCKCCIVCNISFCGAAGFSMNNLIDSDDFPTEWAWHLKLPILWVFLFLSFFCYWLLSSSLSVCCALCVVWAVCLALWS